MKKFMFMVLAVLVCSCSHEIAVDRQTDVQPEIFPDYRNVTVPCNIAPMNFNITEDVEGKMVAKVEYAGNVRFVKVRKGLVSFGRSLWRSMMEEACGSDIRITLCVKTDGVWTAYAPFAMTVSEDRIDPYLAYRLIPPGYTMWKEMSISQRNLENYRETKIYSNLQGKGNCVNCHTFRDRDPDDMLFHLRSELGGTYIFRDGVKEKLDTKTDSTISPLVYPYWHGSGKYVAFTVNTTNEVVHTRNRNVVEVFDEASDVVVYDVERHEIVTSDLLSSKDAFETFPTFSPDGRSLYFCSSQAVNPMPAGFREVKYSLCRVDFNPEDCTFGTVVDTLFNARTHDASVSFPRISPDGRLLVFALSDYGNFSIWHKEADLYAADLQNGRIYEMSALNSDDAESYHSWSSNSRWLVFGTRRDDGLYTKAYFSYIDADGNAHKPFLLPQKDPVRFYENNMYAYNIPEFVSGEVEYDGREIAVFARKGKSRKLGYRKIR
jgi:hypothetical protein